MEIEIFDVGHGSCALLTTDANRRILIDCGSNSSAYFETAQLLRQRGVGMIDLLIVSNYDSDHVTGLPGVYESIPVLSIFRNQSVSPALLRNMKNKKSRGFGIGRIPHATLYSTLMNSISSIPLGIENLLHMMEVYTIPVPLDFIDIRINCFYNHYPYFTDENNLSVVSIFNYFDFGIIFPGDLEKRGWQNLLESWAFREALKNVNVFVASHHGRESGYYPEVFRYCRPEIIIVSDKSIEHETQKTSARYGRHAQGAYFRNLIQPLFEQPFFERRVLTTRKDGTMRIRKFGWGTGWVLRTHQ